MIDYSKCDDKEFNELASLADTVMILEEVEEPNELSLSPHKTDEDCFVLYSQNRVYGRIFKNPSNNKFEYEEFVEKNGAKNPLSATQNKCLLYFLKHIEEIRKQAIVFKNSSSKCKIEVEI